MSAGIPQLLMYGKACYPYFPFPVIPEPVYAVFHYTRFQFPILYLIPLYHIPIIIFSLLYHIPHSVILNSEIRIYRIRILLFLFLSYLLLLLLIPVFG